MQKRSAVFLAPLMIVSVALVVVRGAVASAAGTRGGGVLHLYEADTSLAGNLGTDILTGAVADHGTDHQGIPKDGINKIVLSRGSFSINVNNLGTRLASIPLDPKTCSSAGSATAPTPIVRGTGTGAYRGIRGTLRITASTAVVVPRLKNGKCNTSSTRYWGILLAKGSGIVSYK